MSNISSLFAEFAALVVKDDTVNLYEATENLLAAGVPQDVIDEFEMSINDAYSRVEYAPTHN